jgi:hypothetical protein
LTLSEKRRVSHGLPAEETVSLRLAAVENEEWRSDGEVVAAGVVDELAFRALPFSRCVERVVPLQLAQDDRRVAEQVETVVSTCGPSGLQTAHRECPLLDEVLAIGLPARPWRVSKRHHVRLEQRRVDIGFAVLLFLRLGNVETGEAERPQGACLRA